MVDVEASSCLMQASWPVSNSCSSSNVREFFLARIGVTMSRQSEPRSLRTWRVRSLLVKGVSMRVSSYVVALMDYKHSEIDRVPCWLNMSASFNCITRVCERFANIRFRVLQALLEVSTMATRGMTFSNKDEKIALIRSLSCQYQCKYAGESCGAVVIKEEIVGIRGGHGKVPLMNLRKSYPINRDVNQIVRHEGQLVTMSLKVRSEAVLMMVRMWFVVFSGVGMG